MGKSSVFGAAAFAAAVGFCVPALGGDSLLPPPPVPLSVSARYDGPVARGAAPTALDLTLPVLKPGSKPVDVNLAGVELKLTGNGGTSTDWLFKLCAKAFNDLTGKELPADAQNDAAKAFKEFKKEHVAHEGGAGPKGAVVFFKDRLAISNGDGTVIGVAADGTLDPSMALGKLGDPLGWASGSGGGASASGGSAAAPSGGVATGSGGVSSGGGGAPSGAGQSFSGGSSAVIPPALKEILKRALKTDGLPLAWADSPDLAALLNQESSFSSTAQNPSSTAYGLFQFLDSTWSGVDTPLGKIAKTSDPYRQCVAGLEYIKQRYGDPAKAWAFHLVHNWY